VAWAPGGEGPPEVAFAIGRRVGGAVVRNRLRRRLRDLARASALPSGAWLISAGPGAATAPFRELAAWWHGAVAELTARAGGRAAHVAGATPGPLDRDAPAPGGRS